MLSGATETMPTPSKLWLLSSIVDTTVPVPAVIRSTDIYLRPELHCFLSVLLDKGIDVEGDATFPGTCYAASTSLVAVVPHRAVRESTH